MKEFIAKRSIAFIAASVMALTMSVSASAASNSYDSSSKSFSKTVSASDTTYVYQKMVNSFNTSTNIVLSSAYDRGTTTYSLSTHYGCAGDEYPYRFARVRAFNSNGNTLENKYNYKAADDVVVSAYVDNVNYSSSLAKVDFFGKSTLYNSLSLGLSGDCDMTCTLTFK